MRVGYVGKNGISDAPSDVVVIVSGIHLFLTFFVSTSFLASGNPRFLVVQFFQLHAALLWAINDFPTYSDLSGWSRKGYWACPICMDDRSLFVIRGKISFMGHQCYLLENRVWCRNRLHNGKVERRPPPMVMNGHEILE
ncbi:uncharacterized protein E6C27_scaffold261G00780 [Cucumis melo var. makuwa]|uniref:Uncharacterized protein n=1 Tax=Cucumis melo var. makuwa TaxID=1194695 RepID=A0A5A7SQR6_CUCMM|nr:uncharacterized protein E6C27_scaffold261G00780 [Cucumis melo var. makuwa]